MLEADETLRIEIARTYPFHISCCPSRHLQRVLSIVGCACNPLNFQWIDVQDQWQSFSDHGIVSVKFSLYPWSFVTRVTAEQIDAEFRGTRDIIHTMMLHEGMVPKDVEWHIKAEVLNPNDSECLEYDLTKLAKELGVLSQQEMADKLLKEHKEGR